MIYKVVVSVMPHREILDPQGKAVHQAVQQLGIGMVESIRIGKQIELEIEAEDPKKAGQIAKDAADKILANPIMEEFRIHVYESEKINTL